MLKAWKEGKLIKPDGEVVTPVLKSTEEISNIIGDIYYNHLEVFQSLPPTSETRRPEPRILPIPNEANTPRSPYAKPLPPPRLADVLEYVNDIWYMLSIIPTTDIPGDDITPFEHRQLPGKCPYPKLRELGYIQPRDGAYLYTSQPPQPTYSFTSTTDFEQYIYSLAFHRDISPRTGKMIMFAFLNYKNMDFLSLTAFKYAITALIERASDIYSARRLVELMTSLRIEPDTSIYNTFLLGAMKVESLRSFALILREMLDHSHLQADTATWNIALRMGLKLKSANWVFSVLEVMKNRDIALNHDSIQAIFMALKKSMDCDRMKDYYFERFGELPYVLWKPFNVVLETFCENSRMDEAWGFLVEAGQKQNPPEATLHLFIRTCRMNNDYERAWKVIGDFRQKWNVWPQSSGIAVLFDFAYEREQFSDAILLWQFALSRHKQWKMKRKMKYKSRDFEREYGIPLRRKTVSENDILRAWYDSTTSLRNNDIYHRVPEKLRNHVKLMRARKHSEQFNGVEEAPEDVHWWREIENTYKAVVAMGAWQPKQPPRAIPLRNHRRQYVRQGKRMGPVRINMVARRVKSGWNFIVRGKYMVWRKVQKGELKLEN